SVVCLARCVFIHSFLFYFFFQAEDGIRDRNVTGVQTCALPILFSSSAINSMVKEQRLFSQINFIAVIGVFTSCIHCSIYSLYSRSEERRVGKENKFGSAPALKAKKCKLQDPLAAGGISIASAI